MWPFCVSVLPWPHGVFLVVVVVVVLVDAGVCGQAQRGQVVVPERDHGRDGQGGQLPVHDDRAQPRRDLLSHRVSVQALWQDRAVRAALR